jgi:hypothetical protein
MKTLEKLLDSDIGFRIIRGLLYVWLTVLIVFVLTVIISIEHQKEKYEKISTGINR